MRNIWPSGEVGVIMIRDKNMLMSQVVMLLSVFWNIMIRGCNVLYDINMMFKVKRIY